MNRAIFLDRDNTLIHADDDLGDPAQVKLIQGAASAIASVRGLGYKIIVVSNQGGVARGKYTEEDVGKVNNRISELVQATSGSGAMIDRFYYCPFHPEGTVESYRRDHPWRKPQPGMLLQAIKDLNLDPGQCWMIGDHLRDVQAGAAAGVRTILLRPDAGEQPPLRQGQAAAQLLGPETKQAEVLPDFVARNLIEAVRVVAQQRRPEGVDDARVAATTASTASPRPSTPVAPSPAAPGVTSGTLAAPVSPSAVSSRATPPATAATAATPARPALTPNPSPSPAAAKPAIATPPPFRTATPPMARPSPAAPVAPPATSMTPSAVAPPPAARPASPIAPTLSPLAAPSAPIAAAPPPVSSAAPPAATPPPPAAKLSAPPAPAGEMTAAAQGTDARSIGDSTVPAPTVEHTLRQILQEVRNQRRVHGEFSWPGVMAIVLIMIAFVCLLGGLLMGSTDSGSLRWFAAALWALLAAIAVLLFRR